MNQKVAHGDVGIAQVRAENRFAKEFIESTASGVTAEESTTLMPRAVELGVTVLNVLFKATEEGRENRIFVLRCGAVDLTAIESLVGRIGVDNTVETTNGQIFFCPGQSNWELPF